jgi:alpha-ketoglutarate-dependent 2,4-dichlorophenoxyacetate dioxygenase
MSESSRSNDAMPIQLFPVTPTFVAEVGDVDLAQPLSDDDWRDIENAFHQYAVLVFPSQTMTPDQHVAFAERFGPLEPNINSYAEELKRERVDPRISDVSNLNEDNEILSEDSRKRASGLANRLWHTDSIFRHVPARVSLLHARTVAPVGGHTEFADMRAAWDMLTEDMQSRLDGLIVEHSIFHSRAKIGMTDYTERERAALPGAKQLLVRTVPESGRRALYLASHAMRIVGMPDADGERLIDELTEFATQRQFVYTHRWRVGDLVIWDNRCTMHRGTEYDERRWKRDMARATVTDVGNTIEIASQDIAASAIASAAQRAGA